MQFIKHSVLFCLFGLSSLDAAQPTNMVLTQDPCTVNFSNHHNVTLRSINKSDENKLSDLIQSSNQYQAEINPVKEKNPYALSSATFYVNKAKERSATTGFYGLISETQNIFFAQGCMSTLYEKEAHKPLNHFFCDYGLTRQKDLNGDYGIDNMEPIDNGGVVAIAFGAKPFLKKEKIKHYWKAFIEVVESLKENGHKLTYATEGQHNPKLLAFIAPGYDTELIETIKEVGFTVFDRNHETHGGAVHTLYPELDRVMAVYPL